MMLKQKKKDMLIIRQYDSRKSMGNAAALETERLIIDCLKVKQEINMIFAAAPSQNEFLSKLVTSKNIQWSRINAFHMDEYVGIKKDAPQSFVNFLNRKLFHLVPFKNVYLLDSQPQSIDEECGRYEKLLRENKVDIVCLGIGENGHIAFNDPHVALFNDEKLVKKVDLDNKCRMQQVNDGCFQSLEQVPRYAITLTIPALMSASYLICVVPSLNKAKAVRDTVCGEISQTCPASIMRRHESAVLFLDQDSAKLLNKEL